MYRILRKTVPGVISEISIMSGVGYHLNLGNSFRKDVRFAGCVGKSFMDVELSGVMNILYELGEIIFASYYQNFIKTVTSITAPPHPPLLSKISQK